MLFSPRITVSYCQGPRVYRQTTFITTSKNNHLVSLSHLFRLLSQSPLHNSYTRPLLHSINMKLAILFSMLAASAAIATPISKGFNELGCAKEDMACTGLALEKRAQMNELGCAKEDMACTGLAAEKRAQINELGCAKEDMACTGLAE